MLSEIKQPQDKYCLIPSDKCSTVINMLLYKIEALHYNVSLHISNKIIKIYFVPNISKGIHWLAE